ncbi:cell surface glycoprotein CD200 receptor 1-B isoform X2 [Toxotes jaculatrix]|uniref:cell surface glycoprotein CD200 receptor 1-B isoform X2 n=1 Tax=Toxotes jaculatrix TaxID=941984 RepID=UPI001B3AFF16|nr:cell surface glycoprotein CD200 receptor 1-B isoform X2 [Toxotes jaculatrix]
MRDMMWVYAAIILSVSEAWSLDPGTNQSTSTNSSIYSPALPVHVKNLAFNLGSDVNLTCSNKTWNEIMFVIWEIQLESHNCKIAFNNDGQGEDSCNDGKSLRNTSSYQSYLHIPSFSTSDVGVYKCELVYNGGTKNDVFHATITVPPIASAWIESRGNKMVAVCKAERGKPAANISWNLEGNSTTVETMSGSDGLITVESRLELTEGMNMETLTCAVSYLNWKQDRIFELKHKKGYFPLLLSLLVVVVVVFLVGFLFFAQKKQMWLRRCQQPDSLPAKSPPTEDVEEVEPYASYIQRVNSIYN